MFRIVYNLFVLFTLQIAPQLIEVNPPPQTADYYPSTESNLIDSYHSPEYCFEQTPINYLLDNEGKWSYFFFHFYLSHFSCTGYSNFVFSIKL